MYVVCFNILCVLCFVDFTTSLLASYLWFVLIEAHLIVFVL